jgi:hypothetical protein
MLIFSAETLFSYDSPTVSHSSRSAFSQLTLWFARGLRSCVPLGTR